MDRTLRVFVYDRHDGVFRFLFVLLCAVLPVYQSCRFAIDHHNNGYSQFGDAWNTNCLINLQRLLRYSLFVKS